MFETDRKWPSLELNTKHRLNPEAGDYWNEMFVPVMVVVDVRDECVVVCKKIKNVGDKQWTWDLSKLEKLSREDFANVPLYGTASMGEKTFCDVVPESHKWVTAASIDQLLTDVPAASP